MNNAHIERINAQISFVISDCVSNKLNDARIANNIITITKVDTSTDYSVCKVSVAVLNGTHEERENIIKVLTKSSGFIKKEIASRVRIRLIPKLVFQLDDNSNYSLRINEILNSLNIPKEEGNDETDN